MTKGALSGNAGESAREEFKVNGEHVDTPQQGVVGIPFLDTYVEQAALDYLDRNAGSTQPFFMSVNFMKVHQPNLPHPDFIHQSLSKSKYADSVVEADARIGHVMDKVRALGLDKNTYIFWTTDNGAWQDVYPDAGYTPFRGTKGTVREGGNRFPAMAWGPKIKANTKNHDIVGGLDYMATFAALAGAKLPDKDRDGQPIMFDSYDMSPISFDTGKSAREAWFYFTEDELSPGAFRWHNWKFVFNLRGDDGASTGGLAVDTNLGWKGAGHRASNLRSVGGSAGALRHLHEQLYRKHLDRSGNGTTTRKAHEDPRRLSAAQASGLRLYGSHHAFELPEVPVGERTTREGRCSHFNAHRQLTHMRTAIPELSSGITSFAKPGPNQTRARAIVC